MLNQQIAHSFATEHGARVALGRISEINRCMPMQPENQNTGAHSASRQQQLRASEYLLTRELDIPDEIIRNEKGAPLLTRQSGHISISHTHDHIALMTHPNCAVGIDIELVTRDISSMISRFTTDRELGLAQKAFPGQEAIFVWSCKESLFKVIRREGVHFREQLTLTAIEPGRVTHSLWHVNHPELKATFRVKSSILDQLVVSYIDEPGY